MNGPVEARTSATLLGRLRLGPGDALAWDQFVANYGPRIYAWCRAWGVQDADSHDVTQAVLAGLVAKLREFDYDPARSFRGWLRTLTRHAWRDHFRTLNRGGKGEQVALAVLDQIEGPTSLVTYLEEAFDQEVFREAMARVQLRVEPRTWEAFRLLAIEEWSGADAARHLGMKVMTAFVARSKVQRMLREEVSRLEGGG